MALGENAKKLWQTWDVRGFILISLFIQFFLLFFAPFRKRTKNWVVHRSIWLAYLAADWVAAFVVGLILNGPASSTDTELLVYWTPFLLIHLGGPDTITAFSFEDNELWDRHLLQFLVQVATTGYLFYQSLHSNKLLAPTLLIYLAGIIKYGERVRSLYLASLSKFRDTLLKEDKDDREEGLLANKLLGPKPVTLGEHGRLVTDAFCLFQFFQRAISDSSFTTAERDSIQKYFLKIERSGEAFRIIEIELNLFYEVLYTKIIAFNQWLGYSLRFVSFSAILISLVLWHDTVDKSGYLHRKIDVQITYTLLIGVLATDIIAFSGLALSDWMIGYLGLKYIDMNRDGSRLSFCYIKGLALKTVILVKSITWSAYNSSSGGSVHEKGIIRHPQNILRMLLHRWSRTVPQSSNSEFGKFFRTSGGVVFTNDMMDFIFHELKKKATHAKDNPQDVTSNHTAACRMIVRGQAVTREFDQILVIWGQVTGALIRSSGNAVDNEHMNHCVMLSEYMWHLIKDHTILMSTLGTGRSRYLEACKNLNGTDVTKDRDAIFAMIAELQGEGAKKWEILASKWVELLCYVANACRPRDLIAQVSQGGELITFVWSLMAHFGLGKHYTESAQNEVEEAG